MIRFIALLFCLTVVRGFRYNYADPKIYTFAFTQIEPGSFFNGTDLVGARVELMKEVCCRAGKRCDAAMVDFARCWNSDNLSEVLNGRWYDVCLEVSDTPRKKASYSFSGIHFFDIPNPVIVVPLGSNVTLEDLKNPRNNIKVVVLGNPELATATILEEFLKEFFVKPENIVSITGDGNANRAVDAILKIVNDPCEGGQAIGLIGRHLINPGDPIKILAELDMDLGKSTIMVRKDDQGILDWWDYSLQRFMCSPDYAKFCERLDKELGAHPLNCPPADQVDCSDCTISHRVPGCPCPGML